MICKTDYKLTSLINVLAVLILSLIYDEISDENHLPTPACPVTQESLKNNCIVNRDLIKSLIQPCA